MELVRPELLGLVTLKPDLVGQDCVVLVVRELVIVILGCVLLNEVDLECVALDVVRRDQDIGVDVEWVSWDSVDFEWLGLDWLGDSVVTEGHI